MNKEVEPTRDELTAKAKELYSKGSRNYLLRCYSESADELSEVCTLYEEIYGELSDELGMPYLLYAKSLIALALDENKVVDVPDEEEENENDEDTKENDIDTTVELLTEQKSMEGVTSSESLTKPNLNRKEEATVKPSTSNGVGEEDEYNETTSSLQLAWEILELAAKIFIRQGLNGLPNLAEVQTELGNIEFENNILDSAREDYERALKIYKNLTDNYRRARAELHYKIGLTYLMQQMNQEGAESLKNACALIEDEINEMRAKKNLVEKDIELIKDMEETKQEIWAKIAEIEETRQQNIAEVRAALDNYIRPTNDNINVGSGSSSSVASSCALTTSPKPTDITHLIKRKKPDIPPSSEAEATASPAKKTAV